MKGKRWKPVKEKKRRSPPPLSIVRSSSERTWSDEDLVPMVLLPYEFVAVVALAAYSLQPAIDSKTAKDMFAREIASNL